MQASLLSLFPKTLFQDREKRERESEREGGKTEWYARNTATCMEGHYSWYSPHTQTGHCIFFLSFFPVVFFFFFFLKRGQPKSDFEGKERMKEREKRERVKRKKTTREKKNESLEMCMECQTGTHANVKQRRKREREREKREGKEREGDAHNEE